MQAATLTASSVNVPGGAMTASSITTTGSVSTGGLAARTVSVTGALTSYAVILLYGNALSLTFLFVIIGLL
jgi:hypothetical protein